MDEKDKQKNTGFDRLKPITREHFRPLPTNSMMIRCEQKAGLHQAGLLPHPFVNFKIEILNNCQKKRKSDDTATCYETPAKKIFSPNALSPDLGCVMDFSTPTSRQHSFSPLVTPKLSLLDSSQTVSSEINRNVSSQQQSQQVKCGLPSDLGNIKVTLPHSLTSDKVPSDPAPDFDCDVEDILCLNPAAASTAAGFSEKVESCTFPSGHTLKENRVSPSVAHRQKLEKAHWQIGEIQKEQNKVTGKDQEEDKGYLSVSYIKELELGKNFSQSGSSQLPFVTYSPHVGVVKAPKVESRPESSIEQNYVKQANLSVKEVFFTERDICPIVNGPQLGSVNFPEELLEGDVEEVWNIGHPILESSRCQTISVKLDRDGEQVSEKLEGNVTEPSIHKCQATLGLDETTFESTYDSTLPLVKVKSVVIALNQPGFNNKLTSCSEQNAYSFGKRAFQPARVISTAQSSRPVIFKTKADLEREKRLYVHSVRRHMDEKPPANPVTELQDLMTHVADHISGQWQHPSDLTRRNYKKRFGSVKPNMPLSEWQAKNCTTRKRFSEIPKIFERSKLF